MLQLLVMSDLDSSVIKHTQQTLGKYVRKPPLTEKLLTKPPFRFLHDVFNAVIKETGCFVGLYTPDELNSDNIKDRDDKMKFLQKMIDVIKITSNKPLKVRTSKIVAGLEPEKTNELLQLMGEVIENKLDWKSAVEEVLNIKGPETAKTITSNEKPVDKKIKDKRNEKSRDKENRANDVKPRDGKKVVKTIPPPVKSDKLQKRSTDTKVKIDTGKVTKPQLAKGAKDKNEIRIKESTEKPKLSKEKTSFQYESTSSKNNENSENIKTTSKTLRHNSLEHGSFQKESKIFEMQPENVSTENSQKDGKSLEYNPSSPQTILQDKSQLDKTQDSTTMSISGAGSGKSSAKRKKSSGNIRRSSFTVAVKEEEKPPQDEPVIEDKKMNGDNHNMGDNILIKATSGTVRKNDSQWEEQKHVEKSITEQHVTEISKKQSPIQSPAPPPTAAKPIPTEVRRESTFTRENSRDSTNSNATNRPRTSLRPPSVRPASARPGAPRRRDRNIEIVLQPNDKMNLSGINVKLETFGDLDDDGENLVVIEDANNHNIGELTKEGQNVDDTNIESNLEQQGHLVQQILETQKELMQQQNGNSNIVKEKDLDFNSSSTGRQSSARQMNNLRDIIQSLTKAVNPFGKLMDFVPEDIDAMQLELTMWRDTYTQVANDLRREKSLTESATEPMKNQLVQIEANIKEFIEMIDASRTKILQNSQKIVSMLTEQ